MISLWLVIATSAVAHAGAAVGAVAAADVAGAAGAESPAIKVSVDWGKTVAVSKTAPTLIACPFRPLAGASPSSAALQDTEFGVLRDLNARFVRWHLINASRHVAEISPPTKKKTSWDFSSLDADMIRFLNSSKGREPVINFTLIPYWMFKTGTAIPSASNSDDPNVLRGKYGEAVGKELVDPSGRQVAEYFARIVSWYTQGGFTDENGVYHRSGYHYEFPWWGVLNELDGIITIQQYTLLYDSIVSAVHAVSPNTRFVGLSLGLPSLAPESFEYFLNPRNHRPGIPLDMIAYHFYAGAFGLGGSSPSETIDHWQYTFFNQAAGLLSTARYIDSIRDRLSPTTQVNVEEIGGYLSDDVVSVDHPETAKAVPALYWNLNGAVFAYLYIELARQGIDVATISGIYDRPHGLPGHIPSITYIDPATGATRAPLQVVELISEHFGPGDKLVATADLNGAPGISIPELSSSDIAVQGFVTAKGKKLLVVNKRLREVNLDLSSIGSIGDVELVDEHTRDRPTRIPAVKDSTLRLKPFAVAVVSIN